MFGKLEPLVSVVMCIYNAEQYLRKSISSILQQTYKNFELIVVNDCSTDSSIDIIKSFKDKRIILFNNNVNTGVAISRNTGIKHARGEYIAIMDADDICRHDRFKTQVEYLKNNSEIGVCGSWVKIFGDRFSYVRKYPVADQQIKLQMMFRCCLANPTVMIRRQVLINNQCGYDEKFSSGEDYALWINLLDKTAFYNIPAALLFYRVHNNQLSAKVNVLDGKIHFLLLKAFAANGFEVSVDNAKLLALASARQLKKISELKQVASILSDLREQNTITKSFDSTTFGEAMQDMWYFYCKASRHLGLNVFNTFVQYAVVIGYKYSIQSKLGMLLMCLGAPHEALFNK